MEPVLALFDIDGTLIASGGAGERALRAAVEERFGVVDDLRGIEIAGRTDTGIAKQLFARFGKEETEEEVGAFFDAYLRHLERLLPTTNGRLLPGVIPLLDALAAREDVLLGLLTGNLERGAKLKLTHFGVWHYFGFGAYADDHHDRNQLGRFACSRVVERHGCEIPAARIFVIGDTPHDISCGRAFEAKTVAVATGIHSREQLEEHRPDFLFDDLSDVPAVLRIFQDGR